MEQQTSPTNINLIVTRDGELDQEFYRQQQLERVGHSLVYLSETVKDTVFTGLGNAALNIKEAVALRTYDWLHGTDFSAQVAAKRQYEAQAAKAESLGLAKPRRPY